MDNIWYYISLYIFIYIVIRNSKLDIKNLLLMSSICIILFFVYKRNHPKLSKSNEHLQNNIDFSNLISRSRILKDLNRYKYQEIIDKIGLFLENYNNIKRGIKVNHYQNSFILRKDILNIISSYEVSNEISEEIDLLKRDYIKLLDLYMKNMELEVNIDMKNDDLNINSSVVYFNDPEAYNQQTDYNFDIF